MSTQIFCCKIVEKVLVVFVNLCVTLHWQMQFCITSENHETLPAKNFWGSGDERLS